MKVLGSIVIASAIVTQIIRFETLKICFGVFFKFFYQV